jgi:ribonuclease HII
VATIADLLAETWRLRLMTGLEELLRSAGYLRIAGVDEAGRGSLAGPVVAAAVIVGPEPPVPGVDDSKVVPAELRERLEVRLRRAHPISCVVAVEPEAIDRLNILEASRLAMQRALQGLSRLPDLALVDAVRVPGLPFPCLPVIRGDAVSYAVACASILAKVARDRLMQSFHADYPDYGFAANKGYGSQEHREALARQGPCPIHRLTFRSVLPRAAGPARLI